MTEAEQQLISESDESRQQFIAKLIRRFIYSMTLVLCLFVFFMVRQAIEQAPPVTVEVKTDGLSELEFIELNKAMQSESGGSFFSTNLSAIRKKAGSFAWIDEVNITRDWNKGVVVEVLSKQPIARFGSENAVDAKGDVYQPVDIEALEASNLVMLQGSPDQAEAIMQQMQQINTWYEPLGLSVEDIILTPRMTWLIQFDSGLRLLVDGENTSQKLLSVSQVLQTDLVAERDKIQSIDLRYKNGFAIAWKPTAQTQSITDEATKNDVQHNES